METELYLHFKEHLEYNLLQIFKTSWKSVASPLWFYLLNFPFLFTSCNNPWTISKRAEHLLQEKGTSKPKEKKTPSRNERIVRRQWKGRQLWYKEETQTLAPSLCLHGSPWFHCSRPMPGCHHHIYPSENCSYLRVSTGVMWQMEALTERGTRLKGRGNHFSVHSGKPEHIFPGIVLRRLTSLPCPLVYNKYQTEWPTFWDIRVVFCFCFVFFPLHFWDRVSL